MTRKALVETHGGWLAARARRRARALLALASMAGWLAFPALAHRADAAPQPPEARARVLWARGQTVAVAAPDSFAAPGDTLELSERSRTVATCEVRQIVSQVLAIAQLARGSLAGVRRLDRLRVHVTPVSRPLPATLRVGLPADARVNLLVRCARVVPVLSAWGEGWRPLPAGAREARYARDQLAHGAGAASTRPETLVVRPFADAVDEEIALERGELDVAVFWPGELGSRLRDDARFSVALARLTRGVLAAAPHDTGAARATTRASLEPLERLLRGDLEPLPGATALAGARLEADTALPGWGLVEQALAEGAPNGAAPTARLFVEDASPEAPGLPDVTRLYALRATVVSARTLQAVIQSLGAERFASLLECPGEGSR